MTRKLYNAIRVKLAGLLVVGGTAFAGLPMNGCDGTLTIQLQDGAGNGIGINDLLNGLTGDSDSYMDSGYDDDFDSWDDDLDTGWDDGWGSSAPTQYPTYYGGGGGSWATASSGSWF